MAKVLIVYSTTDGHTREICNRLREVIEQKAHQVILASIPDVIDEGLESFEKIVVGASIRYGKHRPAFIAFIKRHAKMLNRKPSAFFSVSVVARKPSKNQPQTNPYVRRLLSRIAWRPREVGVFAGKIDYPKYGPIDRAIIRFIMLLTGGPTDSKAVVEFTDWRKVEEFGEIIARM